MRGKTAAIALAFALATSLSAASLARAEGQDAKKDAGEEEAKTRIAEFKKELKNCKTDQDLAKAIERLGGLQHPKILAELKLWLPKPSFDVAAAAAEQISKYRKDKDAAETLVHAAGNRRDKEGIVKCLRYAGDVEYRPITGKLTGYFKHKEVDVAKEAVDSCGKLRSKEAIDPLLNLLRELENIRDDKVNGGGGAGGLGGLGGGGLGGVQQEQQKRKQDLTPAVTSALTQITGENHKTYKEWNDWWRKAKATFKESD
jgi:hypothetical protein